MTHHVYLIADTQSLIDMTGNHKDVWIQYRRYLKMDCFPPPSPSTSMIKSGTRVLGYVPHQGKTNLQSAVEQPKFTEGKPIPKNHTTVA